MNKLQKISCTRKKKSSLKSIEFSLGKAQVPQEKDDFFEEQCTFFMKGPKFFKKVQIPQ
jgi:hypothetical protein